MTSPDRGYSPLPGESSLGPTVMLGFTALSAVGLVAAFIFGANSPTLWVLGALLAVSVGGLVYYLVARSRHLRRVRNGDVIEREPWTGADNL